VTLRWRLPPSLRGFLLRKGFEAWAVALRRRRPPDRAGLVLRREGGWEVGGGAVARARAVALRLRLRPRLRYDANACGGLVLEISGEALAAAATYSVVTCC